MNYKIPLVRPFLPNRREIDAALDAMFASGRLTNFGPFSKELERTANSLFGVRCSAAVSNATTGLWILLNNLPRGGEVILPSFTFVATAQAIVANSKPLIPVFADIDPQTLNISPESVESCITPRTVAVVAVHAFGNPCDVESLQQIAARHHVPLYLDAAHAFGSRRRGRPVGGFGDAEVFSLSATKIIPGGEGGVITTNSDILHRAALDRCNYGLSHDNSRDCLNDGVNGKLTEFCAILGLKEIETLEWRIARRNEIARRYIEGLKQVRGIRFQQVDASDVTTWKDFTVQIDSEELGLTRDSMRIGLAQHSIETTPYFWPALHQMGRFRGFLRPGQSLPYTEAASASILSLPMFEELANEDVERVIDTVTTLVKAAGAARTA